MGPSDTNKGLAFRDSTRTIKKNQGESRCAPSMIQIKYNAASAKGLVAKPQDRVPQAAAIMDKLGGCLIDSWFTFGQWDAVIIKFQALACIPHDRITLLPILGDAAPRYATSDSLGVCGHPGESPGRPQSPLATRLRQTMRFAARDSRCSNEPKPPRPPQSLHNISCA